MNWDKTALYRHYNSDGDLLYVGISKDPLARFETHKTEKPWIAEVASITVQWFRVRNTAGSYERGAIRWESPRYNKQSVVAGTPAHNHFLAIRNLNQSDDYHAMLAILIAQSVKECKDLNLPIYEEAMYEFAVCNAILELSTDEEMTTECADCNKLTDTFWLAEGHSIVCDAFSKRGIFGSKGN